MKNSKSTINEHVSLHKASKMLGVTSRTLRTWDKLGKIKTTRTASNYRVVPLSEITRFLNEGTSDKTTIAYCRVSTRKQTDNLERQVGRVLEYCNSRKFKTELFKDVGSGLNDNRKNYLKLIERISQGDISRVVVEHKDRLTRFGFDAFKKFCEQFGTEISVIEPTLSSSFEEELSNDLIALITVYSARLYGRRGGRK